MTVLILYQSRKECRIDVKIAHVIEKIGRSGLEHTRVLIGEHIQRRRNRRLKDRIAELVHHCVGW